MEASATARISHGIMDDDEDELGTPSFSSSTESTSSNDSSEFMDDATTASPLPIPSEKKQQGALYQMSSLMAQLPFKRGLSKHFRGKSQSFTSLSNARSLEDLAKPERPYRKRLKPCRSYGGGLDAHKTISKKPHRSSGGGAALSSSPLARRHGFLGGSRPPVAPHRSSSFSAQTLLFA